jgi:hypothetical protein
MAVSLTVIASACGPEPTDPSPIDLTGTWQSHDSFSVISDVKLHIVQHSDGSLVGDWNSLATPSPPGLCLGNIAAGPFNSISGNNTVLEVSIEILGLGEYTAHLTGDQQLKGSIVSCGVYYPLSFVRVTG